jgi:cyclophilin family peptidyl-prolyl cis-trans isomerase
MLIQTGDPSGTGKGGRSIYAPAGDKSQPGFFADEINVRARSFVRKGLLAMANRGQPNTNHSE